MKVPLRFQITEYDCATTTLQNAISFLFEREEIPAEIIRTISLYTLDCYDEEGNIIDVVRHPKQIVYLKVDFPLNTNDLMRIKI